MRLKFALKLKDDASVRDIEGLKNHYDELAVLEYFRNGQLIKWLEQRGYAPEAEQVKRLDIGGTTDFIIDALYDIFAIPAERKKQEDWNRTLDRVDRLKKLKQLTNHAELLQKIDSTVFDQRELEQLLERGSTEARDVVLAGQAFTVSNRYPNVNYFGVNDPEVTLLEEDFQAAKHKITFTCVKNLSDVVEAWDISSIKLSRTIKDSLRPAQAWYIPIFPRFVLNSFIDVRIVDTDRLVVNSGNELYLFHLGDNWIHRVGTITTKYRPYVLESTKPFDLYKNKLVFCDDYQIHLYDIEDKCFIVSLHPKGSTSNLVIRCTEKYIYSIEYKESIDESEKVIYDQLSVSIDIYDYNGKPVPESNLNDDPVYWNLQRNYDQLLSFSAAHSMGRSIMSEDGSLSVGWKNNEVIISAKEEMIRKIALTGFVECIQIDGDYLFAATREFLNIYETGTLALVKSLQLPMNDTVSNIVVKKHRIVVVQGGGIHIYE